MMMWSIPDGGSPHGDTESPHQETYSEKTRADRDTKRLDDKKI